MRSSLVVLLLVCGFASRAHADPAVEVPFDPPAGDALLKGTCAKWSGGLGGTVCSYCDTEDCKMCISGVEGIELESCHSVRRGAPPSFGSCRDDGDGKACRFLGLVTLHCRYTAARSACYAEGGVPDAALKAWVDGTPPPTAGPAVEVPFDAMPEHHPLEGKCVKWSNGAVGNVCSFCTQSDRPGDDGCRMCRMGFDTGSCSYAPRGQAPTFGTCTIVDGDPVCESHFGAQVIRCRYARDRAACYTAPVSDSSRKDAEWIDQGRAAAGTPTAGPQCIEQQDARPGKACVTPDPDGVHGKLCFLTPQGATVECVQVASASDAPTFGECNVEGAVATCRIADATCVYGPYDRVACKAASAPHHDRGGGDSHSYRLPDTLYAGVELGYAKPGASDFYADGYGRSFMFGFLGFEIRVFEGYDLPDPKMRFQNVAGTSSAFVVSSVAYRYQFASSSPLSFSVLGGVAVMHRSLFGVSGDQLPGFEDFPEVQQQLGVGAMIGGGVVLFGLAYVDVRAYPALWGTSGTGDNAASPGGTPITGNAGIRVGF